MALTNEVAVCNRALKLVGGDRIVSLRPPDVGSKGAEDCSEHFDDIRDAVQAAFPWDFCTGYIDFGATTGNTPLYRFEYEYTVPATVLRVLSMENFDDEWKVKRGKLLSHNASQKGEVIYRERDPGMWSPLFVEALVHRLASLLAFTMTKNRGLGQDMFKLYEAVIREAEEVDSQEGSADPLQSNQLTDVRGGYSTPLYGANVD